MRIEGHYEEKHTFFKVVVESVIYYRNESFIKDNTTKEFKRKKLDWSIGDKDGHGPYHTPTNHVQLERDFQLGIILESPAYMF